MASSSNYFNSKALASFALVLAFFVSVARGETTCEQLDQSTCAYAVSSSGMRCVLEKRMCRGGQEKYVCRTSEIEANGLKDWIETDECIEACGLDRSSLGISTDSLLEVKFTKKLCSTVCSKGCPNIVDLYFNLAAAEGVFLPKLCEAYQTNPRRAMAEVRSSGVAYVAAGPVSTTLFAAGPNSMSSELLLAASPLTASPPTQSP